MLAFSSADTEHGSLAESDDCLNLWITNSTVLFEVTVELTKELSIKHTSLVLLSLLYICVPDNFSFFLSEVTFGC